MTRLFIRFYIGVLSVLFAAWYIHGKVTELYFRAERIRVIESAHRGYMQVLVEELAGESDPAAALDAMHKLHRFMKISLVNRWMMRPTALQSVWSQPD